MKNYINLENFFAIMQKFEKLLFLSSLFKSKKLILSSLETLSDAHKEISIIILKFNHVKNNIPISKDPKENKKILYELISKNWKIEKEMNQLLNLMEINKQHKNSQIEFKRNNKIIILDENQNIYSIDTEKLKKYSNAIKKIQNILIKKMEE